MPSYIQETVEVTSLMGTTTPVTSVALVLVTHKRWDRHHMALEVPHEQRRKCFLRPRIHMETYR